MNAFEKIHALSQISTAWLVFCVCGSVLAGALLTYRPSRPSLDFRLRAIGVFFVIVAAIFASAYFFMMQAYNLDPFGTIGHLYAFIPLIFAWPAAVVVDHLQGGRIWGQKGKGFIVVKDE